MDFLSDPKTLISGEFLRCKGSRDRSTYLLMQIVPEYTNLLTSDTQDTPTGDPPALADQCGACYDHGIWTW